MGEHRENPKRGYSLTWSWKSVFDYLIKTEQVSQTTFYSDLKLMEGIFITNLNAFISCYFIHLCYWLTSALKIQSPSFFFRQATKTIYVSVPCAWKESLRAYIFIRNFASNMSLISLFDSWPWAARIWLSVWHKIETYRVLILMNHKYQ